MITIVKHNNVMALRDAASLCQSSLVSLSVSSFLKAGCAQCSGSMSSRVMKLVLHGKNYCGSCSLHEMASSASACTERPFVGFTATDMMLQWKTESLKKQCYMMRQHRPSCTQALQRPMRSLRLGTAPPCPGKCRHLSAFLTQSPCNGNTHSHASWRAGHDLE